MQAAWRGSLFKNTTFIEPPYRKFYYLRGAKIYMHKIIINS